MKSISMKFLREEIPCETYTHAYIKIDFIHEGFESVN
jgi:hypothetical protein